MRKMKLMRRATLMGQHDNKIDTNSGVMNALLLIKNSPSVSGPVLEVIHWRFLYLET